MTPAAADALIARLRARAAGTSTVASAAELADAEQRLGMPLPPLLRRLYGEAGNGGFGPGTGFLGLLGDLTSGDDERALPLWEAWVALRDDARYAAWRYSRTWLPIAGWGCAEYSCVDLADAELMVWRFAPQWFVENGAEDTDWEPTTPEEFAELCDREAPLERWLASWLDGTLTQDLDGYRPLRSRP